MTRRILAQTIPGRPALTVLIVAVVVLLGPDTGAQVGEPWQPLPPLKGGDPRWSVAYGIGICATEYGWCPLAYPERVPERALCYCVTEAGYWITGTTVARQYYGNVNPYFNPWPGVPEWR